MSNRQGRKRAIDGIEFECRIGDRVIALLKEEAKLIHPGAELADVDVEDAAELATQFLIGVAARCGLSIDWRNEEQTSR